MLKDSVRNLIQLLYKVFECEPGSYFGLDFSSGTAYHQAEMENLIVILPHDNQLFVDIDHDLAYAAYARNISLLRQFYDVTGTAEHTSKSGDPSRRHITVSLKENVDATERLILQAFLGSDVKREFLGLQRIKVNDPAPTLFLERKPEEFISYEQPVKIYRKNSDFQEGK